MGSRKRHSSRSLTWLESPRLAKLVHPSMLEKPTLERLRAKILAAFGIVLAAIGPLIASGYFRQGELGYGIAFLLCTALALGTFLAIRFAASPRLSSHLGSLAMWIGTVTGTYALGGITSIATRWFAVIPVLAAVFGGGRLGFRWFVVSWLTVIAFAVAPEYGVVFPKASPVGADQIHQVVTLTTFMLAILGIFATSEMLRVWLVREREQTEEKLEVALSGAVAAARAKDRFMAMMGHELRTPLNAIIGLAELLVEEMKEDNHDAYIEDAESIRSSGRHLLALISDILTTAMFDSGRLQLRPETFKLSKLIDEIEAMILPLMGKLGNLYSQCIDPALAGITLHTDPSKLRQILWNLLENAAKFTVNGNISLRIKPCDGHLICFEITDTGSGIDPSMQATIWGEFVQGDDSSTRQHGGIGLGLALVQRLTTMLEGTATLESVPGEGSTFRIIIPREVHAGTT